MGSPSIINELQDYTFKDALKDIRDRLQRRERDQNKLDGGGSYYKFTLKDAREYLRGIAGEEPSVREKGNIAPYFRNREG